MSEEMRPQGLISGPVSFRRDELRGASENDPRDGEGRPIRERWRECCRYYRFREELPLDLLRCGLCVYYEENGGEDVECDAAGICLCENNRRGTK